MVDSEYVHEMAAYSAWQNGVLVGLMDDLGDQGRHRPCRLYFGTLQATFRHILEIDARLMSMMETPVRTLEADDWASLVQARRDMDALVATLAERDYAWLASRISIFSERFGRERAIPRWLLIVQLFNHQTHHRSQMTTELHSRGIDYGSTDIPFRPDSPF